ncbi:MAG: glycosyltransferase [Pyrinomonadaceae bacterium]
MDGSDAKDLVRPKTTVHITNYYHENSGGVRTNYDRLIAAANRLKRNVVLIVPGETNELERVGEFGKIYRVAAKKSPVFDKRYRLMLPFHYLPGESPIRKILIDEMPDIIEIYDNYSLTLLAGVIRKGKLKQLNRPMLVYFTGERFDTIFKSYVSKGKIGDLFPRAFMANYNLPMFDYFIANSEFVAEELYTAFEKAGTKGIGKRLLARSRKFFKAGDGAFRDRVAICPRGVDTDFFTPEKRSKEFRKLICEKAGIPIDSKIVMTSTRLSPEKNIDVLPQVMESIGATGADNVRMIVAGDGPRKEFLQSESEKLCPGKLVLIGHINKEELANYYANCDVFLHPNPREPFGNVGLEALSSGAACVFPNAGGTLTYANDENSWISEPSAEGFAGSIISALEDGEIREAKQHLARETALENNQIRAIDRLFETYDRMYAEFAPTREAVN